MGEYISSPRIVALCTGHRNQPSLYLVEVMGTSRYMYLVQVKETSLHMYLVQVRGTSLHMYVVQVRGTCLHMYLVHVRGTSLSYVFIADEGNQSHDYSYLYRYMSHSCRLC